MIPIVFPCTFHVHLKVPKSLFQLFLFSHSVSCCSWKPSGVHTVPWGQHQGHSSEDTSTLRILETCLGHSQHPPTNIWIPFSFINGFSLCPAHFPLCLCISPWGISRPHLHSVSWPALQKGDAPLGRARSSTCREALCSKKSVWELTWSSLCPNHPLPFSYLHVYSHP